MTPVALVTGGGVRVGRAIALALARSGYDLLATYNSSPAGAAEVATAARQAGRRAHAMSADLSREQDVVRLARTARERFGRLDLLVNSAASFVANDLLDVTADEWDAVMAVNLRAPFLLIRETAGMLRQARGAVVNIVDLSALRPWTSHPHHSVSKAGLLHLTRVAARRLAPEVRVNAVAPGYVLPPRHHTPDEIESTRRRIPLRRVGTPEDVASAVRFLARADYVTGQVIVVDGGLGLD
ncbi:MAG: SDR family oxidoreductase [Gemmatimonadota bacterium]|nr:SDR family oxidoreductase [Gemmatimonadota bacterium]